MEQNGKNIVRELQILNKHVSTLSRAMNESNRINRDKLEDKNYNTDCNCN